LRPREFLKDYRHEFGSVLDLLHGPNGSHPPAQFAALSEEMKDLVLHLIAAHHGRARPHFPVDLMRNPPVNEAFDPDGHDEYATALAIETPRRFARLQRKYGRWGLAYLESLVRAADYAASGSQDKGLINDRR
jgi:CRISPR-associated endonuclease/helicase Cas3